MWMCACTYVSFLAHAWQAHMVDTWVLGLWALVFMVVEQALCPLSHWPSTYPWLLITGLGDWISLLLFCLLCFLTLYMMFVVNVLQVCQNIYLYSWSISFPSFSKLLTEGWSFLFHISRQCPSQAYPHVTCKPSSSWSKVLYSYQFKGLCHNTFLFKQIKEKSHHKNFKVQCCFIWESPGVSVARGYWDEAFKTRSHIPLVAEAQASSS